MRRLYVVGKRERFAASGLYVHQRQGRLSGLVERWSMHKVDGASLIRVDHDGRDDDGCSRLMQALVGPNGRFERIDRHDYAPQMAQPIKTTAIFSESSVEIKQGSGEPAHIPLSETIAVWLGGWILLGLAVVQAEQIMLLEDALSLRPQNIFLKTTRMDILTLAGRDHRARVFRSTDDGMMLWIDDDAVLLRLEMGRETVTLQDYARRPEMKQA